MVKKEGIECEVCEKWYHTKCQAMAPATYKILQQDETLHWYCVSCRGGVVGMWKKMRERQDRLEEEFVRTRAEVSKLNEEMGKMGNLAVRVEMVEKEAMKERNERPEVVETLCVELKSEKQKVIKMEERICAIEVGGRTNADVETLKESFAQIVSKQEEESKKEKDITVSDREMQEKMFEMM
mgnify:CR=1 FL=1